MHKLIHNITKYIVIVHKQSKVMKSDRGLVYDVWYRKYGGLLKCIQKKYDHRPNTYVRLTHNEIIVITIDYNIYWMDYNTASLP